MERQRSFCLFLPCRLTLQEFYLVGMRLRPSIVVSLSARGKSEGSQVIGDVHKQAVGSLGEMIADGNTLIIGSHDDVEEILLALIISRATPLMFSTLQEVEGHLIVMVTYLRILAIDRLPSIVLGTALHARHLHTFGPHSVGIYRDSHRRLHQMVVDVHAQFAFFHHFLVGIVQAISQFALLLGEDKLVLAIRRRQDFCCLSCSCHYQQHQQER